MAIDNALVVFQDKKIRRTWHDNEWYYSVVDVVEVLTDSAAPSKYWFILKTRELEYGIELSTICRQLKMPSLDGKSYRTECANSKGLFRIIQSIPSRKAEPFKQWLAQLAQERVEEIQDPELAQDRVKRYYELKGYPKAWIDKRLRGIAVRQELTDEWKGRGVAGRDFAILTDEITFSTFGKTVNEYKKFKALDGRNPLRDHMTDWELILTMVGEKATTDITVARDAKGFDECEESAHDGGQIACNTRKELEQKIGKTVVSSGNFVGMDGKMKKLEKKETV